MTRALTAACLLLLAALPVRADEAPFGPTRLTLQPAAAPSPALRYRLLPDLREQKPGDAAPLYRRAVPLLQQLGADASEQMAEWQKMPLGELPRVEIRRFLNDNREALDLVERAARCERCDWGLADRLRKQGINAALPEVQAMRQAAQLLAVRARLEMAEGHLDRAARALQAGLALARQVGEAPPLITTLVGMAVTAIMAQQIDQFVQCAQAPNLYWALTDLPRPFISLRVPLQGDQLMCYGTFPGLAEVAVDPTAGPLTPEQIEPMVKILVDGMGEVVGFKDRTVLALLIRSKHETAKRALVAQGRPRELVEKMPHVQVALLHAFLQYDRMLDEDLKWQSLPYWEARPKLRAAATRQRELLKPGADAPALPLAYYLLPAVDKVFQAQVRTDRRIAALRCVEAVRLYAAHHGGKLPATLGDIQEVPVPHDPLTGQPFQYRAAGGKATLYGAPPDQERPHVGNAVSYELTLKR
jgi:hypothetical protein